MLMIFFASVDSHFPTKKYLSNVSATVNLRANEGNISFKNESEKIGSFRNEGKNFVR